MQIELLTWLIPLPPLVAFALIVLFANRSKGLSHTLAIGAMAVSWALSMLVVLTAVGLDDLGEHPIAARIAWLPAGGAALNFGVLVDPLSTVTLFFVSIACLMIFLYSVGYHNYGQPRGAHDVPGLPPHGGTVEPMYSRFFAFISLFAFAMLLLVVSDNLLLLFIGWEIMGLCSYLLIGFWYGKESAKKAAVKAFMTTRVGDVFMLLGIAYLYAQTGTLSFREILHDAEVLHHLAETPSTIVGLSAAGLAGLLLFAGTIGKSAQFPLHVWLPDAMEGPTPVSAMIHAATMVSAGVYMVIRMFPLLSAGAEHGPTAAMTVMAGVGAFTALFAATIAVAQNDVKRVLAYSTISQLGYMVAALGIGGYIAAAFHLVTHAFFKALLFLGSGSVIHGVEHGVLATAEGHGGGGEGEHGHAASPGVAATHGVVEAHPHHGTGAETHAHPDPQDMLNMGGLRHRMPLTFWTFLIGGFALAGFPLVTAGFWSKDEIFADAFAHGQWLVFGTLALAAFLTAFYTMRQISLTFFGRPRTAAAAHAHETPWTMTAPLVILAFFAITAGWVGIPEHFPGLGGLLPNWFHDFVGHTLLEHPEAVEFSWAPLATSIVVSLGGLGLGWLVYRDLPAGAPDPLVRGLGPIHTLLARKYYIDELYHAVFVRPAYWFAEQVVYQWMDRGVIDGTLHAVGNASLWLGHAFRRYFDAPVVNGSGDLVGEGVKRFGNEFKVIQTGRIQQYLLLVLIGVILFGAIFYFNLG